MRKREKGGKEKDKERVEEGEKKIKRTKEKKRDGYAVDSTL